ncbi:hypothetical protein [Pseudomonas sp. REB1044]|uniref:hypothetical protein n=1 Tax=Pseudomonas sp. REB1044 TaxID=2675224 RepID=UPI00315DC715
MPISEALDGPLRITGQIQHQPLRLTFAVAQQNDHGAVGGAAKEAQQSGIAPQPLLVGVAVSTRDLVQRDLLVSAQLTFERGDLCRQAQPGTLVVSQAGTGSSIENLLQLTLIL